ncbi:SDR family NAD(P)-dependent oxidoreductase [Myxococcota bacterium]|nr:SDR family NAD(P)-dependent oxidoreductase [Myxococcota bacterium]
MTAEFLKFVFTPAGSCDATLAIAASRAGGVGVLNAELVPDTSTLNHALALLAEHARGDFGLKLDVFDESRLDLVSSYGARGLRWLIVDAELFVEHRLALSEQRAAGTLVLAELRGARWPGPHGAELFDEALWEAFDGLVLKGNESGGFVGELGSFVLFQHWRDRAGVPLYVRGGVTPHSAAACAALGAAGAVLDSQLLLLDESPFSRALKPLLGRLSGTETVPVGDAERGEYFRLLVRPDCPASRSFAAEGEGTDAHLLREQALGEIDWNDPTRGLLPIGQDVCFANAWAQRHRSVSAVLRDIDEAVAGHLDTTLEAGPLGEGGSLAQALGVRFPIVQGPMTRVSDKAEFANAVSQGGALPMLAFALMRGEPLERMLSSTARELEGRPWGIGLLGFAPMDLMDEQVAAARRYDPDYAIIAGGRPDQVVRLEEVGIRCFLHVPSPSLLTQFVREGARRFIFEGRECGGHIGPLSSFTLWSSMVDRLCEQIDDQEIEGSELSTLFAGGIHDAASSALVQVLVAPLLARGVQVGILMGSGYLFTQEIVTSRAIVPAFQQTMVQCDRTVNLESGPGHASCCAYTPFAREFFSQCQRQREDGVPVEERRELLDDLILGRLRIASKGTLRSGENGNIGELEESEQQERGMYMAGQVVTLRNHVTHVEALHHEVMDGAETLLRDASRRLPLQTSELAPDPLDVAIVGISTLLPGAKDVHELWDNVLDKINAIGEIPSHRWDWRLYFDADRQAPDKIYSKWGGFLDDLAFDPTRYGIPPRTVESVDPMQLMALEVARRALADAGYENGGFDRERAAVIIGASGGVGDVGMQYGLRSEMPRFTGDLPEGVAERLPEWSEDTFAGILVNVIAGRIANRLDFGGVNLTTDAACASSLAAVYQAASELRAGRSDFALAGGVDTVQGPFGYLCFSKTQALSPRGQCRSFDATADGIVISEGIAMLAMKRLSDAERDGDRVYAVLKGIGASSDGRAKGLTAPLPAGQLAAMRRAYQQAGFGPETVGLFEAHGTGTVAGDTAELESTTNLIREGGGHSHSSVVGSIKTMIGHTKATAGVAGLVKAALALHHRVLPPQCHVDDPNAVLRTPEAPLYLLDEPYPWLCDNSNLRRSAVSSFGFGGTNFHAVLEEYTGEYRAWLRPASRLRWPAELFVFQAIDRATLRRELAELREELAGELDLAPRDLARALADRWAKGVERVAIVAESFDDLSAKLDAAVGYLDGDKPVLPPGVYAGSVGGQPAGVAVLFSGQGSQYPGMLRELAIHFPICAEILTKADEALADAFQQRFGQGVRLSHFILPRGAYGDEGEQRAADALRGTDVAQPALGVVEAALWCLMSNFGLRADMFAGHSYGEFPALYAAGALSLESLMSLSEARGRLIVDAAQAAGNELGTMAAVQASREAVEDLLAGVSDVVVANHNAPDQSIISGSFAEVGRLVEEFNASGINATPVPVAAAFHSKFVEPASAALAERIDATEWSECEVPVYANSTGCAHEGGAEQIKATMAEHLVRPVEFVSEIEAMYAADARIFVELGPKSVLTGLTRRILGDRPHTAIAVDGLGGGIPGLLSALGQLLCVGVDVDLAPLFDGRDTLTCAPGRLAAVARTEPLAKHAWWVNGSGVRGATDPVKQIGLRIEEVANQIAPNPQIGEGTVPATNRHTRVPASDPQMLPPKRELQGELRPAPDPRGHSSQRDSRRSARSDRKEPNVGRRRRATSTDASAVMTEYFETMKQFLRTQEGVMSAFLGQPSPGVVELNSGEHTQELNLEEPPRENVLPTSSESMASSVLLAPGPAPSAPAVPEVPIAAMTQVVESPTVAANGHTDGFDRDKVEALLLQLIEQKTGYPPDMVGVDQDLEAELGIDSIKRVEIVGELLHVLPEFYGEQLGEERSTLNRQATLNGMLDMLGALHAVGDTRPFERAGVGEEAKVIRHLPRYVIDHEVEALDDSMARSLESGHFLVTRDGRGIAEVLSALLSARGCSVELLDADDLVDETVLGRVSESLASRPEPLAGVVHLAPLDTPWLAADAPIGEFRAQLRRNHEAFFRLLRGGLVHLAPTAHVLSASALGGTFAREMAPGEGLSLQGGDVGLLKSLREERPKLRTKAIDLDARQTIDALADQVLAELELCGGRIEVGYPEGLRTVFRTREVASGGEDTFESASDAKETPADARVVLATGGARGITAEVLRELARPGVTLVLQGRTPLPGPEAPEIAALPDASGLRDHFIAQVRSGVLDWSPARMQREVDTVLRARELLANIADLRERGAVVEYHAADVCDEGAMRSLVDAVMRDHGHIEGVVHGAGVIDDKLLEDKTPESWSRVVETKVVGLLLLQKLVPSQSLRFFTVFSSVAGRFGNSGQSDYATANELMNRLCCQLRSCWSERVRVRSLCWGPWAATSFGAGMVSPEVEAKFAAMGVERVEPDVGRALFAGELRESEDPTVEIVLGAGPWEEREAQAGEFEPAVGAQEKASSLLPLLGEVRVESTRGQGRTIHFEIDEAHAYLRDHQMDGKPILPAAVALELIAQGIASLWPDWTLVELSDFRLLKGIECGELPQRLALVLDPVVGSAPDGIEVKARLQSQPDGPSGRPRFHYRAIARLGHQLPEISGGSRLFQGTQGLSPARAYEEMLFHGPLFQVIVAIDGFADGGAQVGVQRTAPAKWLPSTGGGADAWLFDPGAVDAAAQVAILWARLYRDEVALPAGFDRVVRFSSERPERLVLTFERDIASEPHLVQGDVFFSDDEGRVHLVVYGMQCVSSPELNRLVGAATPEAVGPAGEVTD